MLSDKILKTIERFQHEMKVAKEDLRRSDIHMKYFVEEVPKSCTYCDCCRTKEFDSRRKLDGEKFCGIKDMDVEDYYKEEMKPLWCPLRRIPSHMEDYLTINGKVGYYQGWNVCVNRMLNER